MKCDKCGNQSVYRSTLIVNGVAQTTNLCRDCAVKEGVFATETTSLFDQMFSPFIGFMPFEKVEDVVCPVCKTSLKQFKTSGLLGCSNCYEAFGKEIAQIVSASEETVRRIKVGESYYDEKLSYPLKTCNDYSE